MLFGIGFLVASVIALGIIPLVHNRAVRLTMRRLEAATPLSMAEIQADKDQLRAEFAMSTRRLEMSVEQLKAKTTSQPTELGERAMLTDSQRIEIIGLKSQVDTLKAQINRIEDDVRDTGHRLSRQRS